MAWPTGNGNQIATSFRYATWVFLLQLPWLMLTISKVRMHYQLSTKGARLSVKYTVMSIRHTGHWFTNARTASRATMPHSQLQP